MVALEGLFLLDWVVGLGKGDFLERGGLEVEEVEEVFFMLL